MNLRKDIRTLKKLTNELSGKKLFSIVVEGNAILFENEEKMELPEEVIKDIISSVDPKNIKKAKNKIIVKNLDFDKLSKHSLYYIAHEGIEPIIIYDDITP